MLPELRGVIDISVIFFWLVEFDFEDLVVILKGDENQIPLLQKFEIDLDGSDKFWLIIFFQQRNFAVELSRDRITMWSVGVKWILNEVFSKSDWLL